MLAGAEGQRLRDYWLEQLAGDLPLLDLPVDRPRPATQQFDGEMAFLVLDGALSERLHSLGQAHGATLYMTLLAAFQVLLYRYTGQEDLLVGTVLAGRDRPELAGTAGYFINPVALRADLSGDPPFVEFLGQVRERVLGAYDHQEYPLPLLAEQLQLRRDPGRPPIFETMFIMQKAQAMGQVLPGEALNALALGLPGFQIELGELTAESLSLGGLPAQFDLTLMMAEVTGGLAAALHYNTVLFSAETAERMLGHLQVLLIGLAAEPERPVSLLPLLPEFQRERLLYEWNDTTLDYPAGGSFYRLFEEQVARTPEAAAVTDGEISFSYRELNQRANQLAHYLVALGVGPEVLVGAALERSAEMVAALLAVHKAGGAYIPLDPAFPQARLEMMLADARPAVLLAGNSLITEERPAWLPTDTEVMQVINLEEDWPQIAQYPVENLTGQALPDSLAYMIYTSGSTGRPKGVQISQRALVNFLTTMAERPGLAASDTLLAVTTLSFDIAGLESLGIILAAAYILYLVQRMIYGPASPQMLPKLTDLNGREFGMLVPLVVLVFWIGLYPKPLLDVMHASVARVIASQSTSVMVQEGGDGRGHTLAMTAEASGHRLIMKGDVAP
jgi:non-ribosomal peptide synthetase component F